MDIAPIPSSPVQAANLPLEHLAANSHLTQKEKIAEVSRAFEAVLLRQILQQAQKTVFRSSLISESSSTGIYRDLATTQLAENISRAGTFGLAKVIAQQLDRQLPPPSATPDSSNASEDDARPSQSQTKP
ncbi:MAG: rod-binding protein [Candidatus Omnitrophica bacterium]|nr:rod-binding protein [Candidatus Omnitrophota bacterium]